MVDNSRLYESFIRAVKAKGRDDEALMFYEFTTFSSNIGIEEKYDLALGVLEGILKKGLQEDLETLIEDVSESDVLSRKFELTGKMVDALIRRLATINEDETLHTAVILRQLWPK